MPNPLETKISGDLENKLKAKFGIPTNQPLPPAFKIIVDKTAKDIDMSSTERYVKKEALLLGRQYYRDTNIQNAIQGRLSTALAGVRIVSQSADLQKMVDENAKMLFAKRKALENAGFLPTEAFDLILAEVSAKKAK